MAIPILHRILSTFRAIAPFCRHYRGSILIVAVLVFALPDIAVYFHNQARGADFFGYVRAGQDALHGRDLYAVAGFARNNTWPPFFSFFVVPLALSMLYLGSAWTRLIWYAVNLLCFFFTVRIWIHMLLGNAPVFLAHHHRRLDCTHPLVFIPVLFVLPGLVNNFFMLQINVLVLFLVSAGFSFARRQQAARAGMLLGLAAALKAIPGLALLYFILRRQWKIAAWMALSGAVLTLLPVLVYGPQEYIDLIGSWLRISFPERVIIGWGNCNDQSFPAMWERYLAHLGGMVEPGSPVINVAAKISSAALLATTAAVFVRQTYTPLGTGAPAEYAAVCILMVLSSPIAWRHYWVMLYPGAAVSFIYLRRHSRLFQKNGLIKRLMIGWVALSALPFLSRGIVAQIFKALSFHTWSAVVLLVLLMMITRHARRHERDFAQGHGSRAA